MTLHSLNTLPHVVLHFRHQLCISLRMHILVRHHSLRQPAPLCSNACHLLVSLSIQNTAQTSKINASLTRLVLRIFNQRKNGFPKLAVHTAQVQLHGKTVAGKMHQFYPLLTNYVYRLQRQGNWRKSVYWLMLVESTPKVSEKLKIEAITAT